MKTTTAPPVHHPLLSPGVVSAIVIIWTIVNAAVLVLLGGSSGPLVLLAAIAGSAGLLAVGIFSARAILGGRM